MRWGIALDNLWYLLRGTRNTVEIAVLVILLGTLAGVALGTLRFGLRGVLRGAITAAIEFTRATPLLLLMFFIFFGLPAIGVKIPTLPSAVLAMTLWMSVNTAEVVRGALQSIPQGQTDAALASGLTFLQALRHVLFPQALRRMLPPFMGLCTILIKDTSLAAIIGVFELTRAAQETIERTLASFELYLTAAAIYFLICYPLSLLTQRAEKALHAA